ncbi:hypothetical protein QFC20_006958 [Naganishia adeliensis]|uniref:Uncharacterized protein n=1 Tax=Naganishia adeliensis TaxID=92952 RepID=A0ACC2V4Z0_9TREE|nr:hypothetical protein QFC20_006958 [Naganishia adeliensis]
MDTHSIASGNKAKSPCAVLLDLIVRLEDGGNGVQKHQEDTVGITPVLLHDVLRENQDLRPTVTVPPFYYFDCLLRGHHSPSVSRNCGTSASHYLARHLLRSSPSSPPLRHDRAAVRSEAYRLLSSSLRSSYRFGESPRIRRDARRIARIRDGLLRQGRNDGSYELVADDATTRIPHGENASHASLVRLR